MNLWGQVPFLRFCKPNFFGHFLNHCGSLTSRHNLHDAIIQNSSQYNIWIETLLDWKKTGYYLSVFSKDNLRTKNIVIPVPVWSGIHTVRGWLFLRSALAENSTYFHGYFEPTQESCFVAIAKIILVRFAYSEMKNKNWTEILKWFWRCLVALFFTISASTFCGG